MYNGRHRVMLRAGAFAFVIGLLGGAPAPAQERHVLRGAIVDSATLTPIPDAAVVMTVAAVVVYTDPQGRFEMADVSNGDHTLAVHRSGFRSRAFRFALTTNDPVDIELGVFPLAGGSGTGAVLIGRVMSDIGQPVDGAAVVVDGRLAARSDREGRYRARGLGHGPHLLQFQRIGFRRQSFEVDVIREQEIEIDATLQAIPLQLEEIVVDANRTIFVSGRLRDFYQRRNRGFGSFFTRWEIEQWSPLYVTDLFRRVPGIRVVPEQLGGNRVQMSRSSGSCEQPEIFIDGMRTFDADIDNWVQPGDVEGIEVYSGPASVPAQYALASNCGVILIWTR